MNSNVDAIYSFDPKTECLRPLFLSRVPAGFPSPADDYIEGKLDLNKHLIKHPAATFFVRVIGDSMVEAGIYSGDLLIVDRALEAVDNNIVVAILNGELTVKRMKHVHGQLFLVPENKDYSPIHVLEESDFEIWGVVSSVIHKV